MSPETRWQFRRIHTRITAAFLWRFTVQGALALACSGLLLKLLISSAQLRADPSAQRSSLPRRHRFGPQDSARTGNLFVQFFIVELESPG
jgi:hypothetical protein